MKKILFTFCIIFILGINAQTTYTVNTGSYYYIPSSLTVSVGDSVIWINDGGFHDVNGDINSITNQPFNNPVTFDSPSNNIVGAVIFAYKFTIPGTYNYDCSVGSHASAGMIGSVIVNTQNTAPALELTGIMDLTTPSAGNTGKAVMFTANQNISDLSTYGFGSAGNGGGSNGEEYTFPALSINAGQHIIVCRDSLALSTYFDGCLEQFPSSLFPNLVVENSGEPTGNGNDAYELFFNNSVIETFGDITHTYGSGGFTDLSWAYRDSWAWKDTSALNTGNWVFGGDNCSDGSTTTQTSNCPYPMCGASSSGTDTQTACDSLTWIDGITYTVSNSTAIHILSNISGSDSVVTLDLTINNSSSGIDTQTACDSITWIDGVTYTSSNNTATHTLSNVSGCDSVIILDLTITNSSSGIDTQTACDSLTWIDGVTYTASNNTATYTLSSSAGCDSILNLDLTITQGSETDSIIACDSLLWNGNTYFNSGVYLDTFNLSSNSSIPNYYSSINLSLSGDTLELVLSNLISSTQSTSLSYTSNSFDTWDLLKLSDLKPEDTNNVMLVYGYVNNDLNIENDLLRSKDSSCQSSQCYGLWNREHIFPKSLANPSMVISSAGTGTDVHNLRACDYTTNASRNNKMYGFGSGNAGNNINGDWYPGDEWKGDVARIIMYMHLRYPSVCSALNVGAGVVTYDVSGKVPDIILDWNSSDPVSIFEINRNNEIYQVQGNRNPFIDNPKLATSIWGGPLAQNRWSNSCDSIVTLTLTINNTYIGDTTTLVNCQSTSWNGNIYSQTGIYTDTLQSSSGCDSLITLDLTINQGSIGTDVISSCDNLTWIDGVTYTASNNAATHALSNVSGCDSVVTLDLTINNSSSGIDTQTACDSLTWIDGFTYTSNNNSATHILTNAVGCDSLVTLDLTINEFNLDFTESYTLFIAPPFSVQFNNGTPNFSNYNFTWNFGDSTVVQDNNPSIFQEYMYNGLYTVSLIAEDINNGCGLDTLTKPNLIYCSGGPNLSIIEVSNNINVFPNPANENITISINNFNGNIQTEVYDLIGNRLQTTNETTISLRDYARGIYLLKVSYGDKVEEMKVIKD